MTLSARDAARARRWPLPSAVAAMRVAALVVACCAAGAAAGEPPATGWPAGLFRVWTPRGVPARPGPAALPLTPAARAAVSELPADAARAVTGCEPPSMPGMLATPQPVEFVAGQGTITLRYTQWDAERVIYMAPGAAPDVQPHSPLGTSFGRFEGDTLAIFTLYIDGPPLGADGMPQSRDVSVLERYRPTPSRTRLDWTATVTDPMTFTGPVTRSGYYAAETGTSAAPATCLPDTRRNIGAAAIGKPAQGAVE